MEPVRPDVRLRRVRDSRQRSSERPSRSNLDGTPEPDVIVTGGARNVTAGEGSDLVCVTGRTRFLDTGAGDDSATTPDSGTSTLVCPRRRRRHLQRRRSPRPGETGAREPIRSRPATAMTVTPLTSPTESIDDEVDLGPGNDSARRRPGHGHAPWKAGQGGTPWFPSLGFNPVDPSRWVFDNICRDRRRATSARVSSGGTSQPSPVSASPHFARQLVIFRGSDKAEEVSVGPSTSSLGAAGPIIRSIEIGRGCRPRSRSMNVWHAAMIYP